LRRKENFASSERLAVRARQVSATFDLVCAGLRYTATIGNLPNRHIGEIFLNNQKSNLAADTNARDSAIVASLALQYGADIEAIRKALCRDNHGRATGPLGAALDRLADGNAQ
jgi:hypothetical protein